MTYSKFSTSAEVIGVVGEGVVTFNESELFANEVFRLPWSVSFESGMRSFEVFWLLCMGIGNHVSM